MTTYAKMEQEALTVLNGSQGKRIAARMQAAFNYAMVAELDAGNELIDIHIEEGLRNGVLAICAMIERNDETRMGEALAAARSQAFLRDLIMALAHRAALYKQCAVEFGEHHIAPGGHA